MKDPKVVDNDKDEITVMDGDKEIRGWSYANDTERRVKMLCAHEFVEGWYQTINSEPLKTILDAQQAYDNPVHQVAFRAGFILCREIMARFVEQGGDAATAQSIRANWLPHFGVDPGGPRKYDFAEVTESDDPENGPWKAKNPGPSVDGAVYALTVMAAMDIPLQPQL